MNTQIFLAELKQAGMTVSIDGDKLNIKSKVSPVPADWVKQLKARKQEVIAFLLEKQCGRERQVELSAAPAGVLVEATSNQKRLWLLDNQRASGAYNIAVGYRLYGKLDCQLFESCVNHVLSEHDVFRTQFKEQEGQLYLFEQSEIAPATLGSGKIKETDTDALLDKFATTQFKVAQEASEYQPLYQHGLYHVERHPEREPAEDYYLYLFACHHVIMDGHSLSLYFTQVVDLYEKASANSQQVPFSPYHTSGVGFRDYAYWLQSGGAKAVIEGDLQYWLDQYQEVEHRLVFAPISQQEKGADSAFRQALPATISTQIQAFSAQHNVTPFSVYYAAFKLLLSQISGQRDFLIGHPVASRQLVAKQQLQQVIGYFANTIALRVPVGADDSFISLVNKVQQANIQSLNHQHAPFEKIIEAINPDRNAGESPLIQSFFAYQHEQEPLSTHDLDCVPVQRLPKQAKFPLTLIVNVKNSAEQDAELIWEYSGSFFNAEQIDNLAQRFEILTMNALSSSDCPALSLDYFSARDKQCLYALNHPHTPLNKTDLWQSVESHFAQAPSKALIQDQQGDDWSYQDFASYAGQIVCLLKAQGLQSGDVVLVSLKRSVQLMAVNLAALRLGIVLAACSPDHPQERLNQIASNTGAKCCLCEPELVEWATQVSMVAVPEWDSDYDSIFTMGEREAFNQADRIYIVHTSGSTGNPKGIEVSYGALNALMNCLVEEDYLRAGEKTLLQAGESFDPIFMEIWLPLFVGAQVFIADPQTKADVYALAQYIHEKQLDVALLPPVYLEQVLSEPELKSCFKQMRIVSTGGDALSIPDGAADFKPEVLNMYGPSENTIISTIKRYVPGTLISNDTYSIGRPLSRVTIHILSSDGRICAPGVVGEIALAGELLANGYSGNPELTFEKFVSESAHWSERHYLTGDLGYIDKFGELIFLGRKDYQVQIRGFRVEPGEIEQTLCRKADIYSACVIYDKSVSQLKAFVTPKLKDSQLAECKEYLASRLPHYMLPQVWVSLSAFPLTANDKIDRQKLAEYLPDRVIHGGSRELDSDQKKVAEIYARVLNVSLSALKPESNFFELGGHSLLAMKLQSECRKAGYSKASMGVLLSHPTIAGFASAIFPERVQRCVTDIQQDPQQTPLGDWDLFDFFHALCEKHQITQAQFAIGKAGQILMGSHGLDEQVSGDNALAVAPHQRLFRISCNAKVLTLILGLKLAEMGVVDLDAALTSYLPQISDFPDWDDVTLRHLFNHRSGLDFGLSTRDIQAEDTLETVVERVIQKASRYAQAGSMFGYSMTGNIIIAHVFEKLTGEGYFSLLERHVLNPAGSRLIMTDSPDGPEFVTAGHTIVDGHRRTHSVPAHTPVLASSGSLGSYMSAQDLLQVCLALITKDKGGTGLLRDSSIEQVFNDAIPVETHPVLVKSGMSFFLMTNGFWGHLGDGDGQHSYIQIDTQTGTVMVCQTTLHSSAPLFWELSGRLFPDNSKRNTNVVAEDVQDTQVKEDQNITGVYQNAFGRVLTRKEGEQMSLVVTFTFPRERDSQDNAETSIHPLRQVDEAGRVFQLVNPDRLVKGSITYFSNPQGSFMRIGQTIFKKISGV